MNALIIADHMPECCHKCPFLNEEMAPTKKLNTFELVDACYLGFENYAKCELIVIKDLESLENELKNRKENM